MIKMIDRLRANGSREFGVLYADGHVVWQKSYLEAWWAYHKAIRK